MVISAFYEERNGKVSSAFYMEPVKGNALLEELSGKVSSPFVKNIVEWLVPIFANNLVKKLESEENVLNTTKEINHKKKKPNLEAITTENQEKNMKR